MEITQRKRPRMRERVPCNIEVLINDSLTCNAFDINEGGLYLKTVEAFTAGNVVRLSLPFRDDRLRVSARVKYCLEGVGIGLMFIDLDDLLKGKIRALLQDIRNSAC